MSDEGWRTLDRVTLERGLYRFVTETVPDANGYLRLVFDDCQDRSVELSVGHERNEIVRSVDDLTTVTLQYRGSKPGVVGKIETAESGEWLD